MISHSWWHPHFAGVQLQHLPNKVGLGGPPFTLFFRINNPPLLQIRSVTQVTGHVTQHSQSSSYLPIVGIYTLALLRTLLLGILQKIQKAMLPKVSNLEPYKNAKEATLAGSTPKQSLSGLVSISEFPQLLETIILRWVLFSSSQRFPVWLSHSRPQW